MSGDMELNLENIDEGLENLNEEEAALEDLEDLEEEAESRTGKRKPKKLQAYNSSKNH